MVTATMVDTGFVRYARRVRPAWLSNPDLPDDVREQAEQHFMQRAAYDFCHDIALGWRPHELARGQLDADALPTRGGEVRRRPAPDIEYAMVEDARSALRDMEALHLTLPGGLQADLESLSQGRDITAKRAQVVLEAAGVAVRTRRAELRAQQQNAAARPTLRVRVPFTAKGATYATGEYPVEPDIADGLSEWKERMEGQARDRQWDAPEGFDASAWPPFELVTTTAP